MIMDVKTQLHEGMKIAPINSQEKEYTLIFSNKDNKMYALYQTHIIKLDDIDKEELDTKWLCTNLSSLQEEIECIEFENGKIISYEDFCVWKLSESLDSWDFVEIAMKKIKLSRENYKIKKGFTYEIKCRDIIAKKYEEQQRAF